MASPFRTRNAQLHAKVEAAFTSVGDDDVFVGFNPTFKPNYEMNEDESMRNSFGKFPVIAGGVSADLGFSFHMKGPGTDPATNEPEYKDVLALCGLLYTAGVYTPDISVDDPGSVSWNADGQLHVIEGAFGNLKIQGEAGKLVTATADFKGAYVATTDTAAADEPVYDATSPEAFKNATLSTMGNANMIVKSFSIDFNAEISMIEDMSATSAYAGAFYGNRSIKGQLVLEAPDIATLDLYDKCLDNTEGVMSWAWGTAGAGKYNRIAIAVPHGYLTSVVPSDDSGRLILTCEFSASLPGAHAEGGDLTITYS